MADGVETTTLREALRDSLDARRACVGQTWKSFKDAVEQGLGVTDADVLASIEYGVMQGGSGRLVRDDIADGSVEIREVGHGR